MEVKHIGVVGAGTMGNGIAQASATSGYEVWLFDIAREVLDRAVDTIERNLGRMLKKGALTGEQAQQARGRIRPTLDIREACSGADLVFEAVPEVMELKKKVFAQADGFAPAHAILATNTSELSVTEMAMATRRPDRFIGMHWFNPAPVMKLIEIVTGVDTSPKTLEVAQRVAASMGKTTIVCRDSQGFVTTRVLAAMLTESYRIHEEGLASKEDIDQAIKLAFNFPMGPFELSDFVGLDVLVHAIQGMVEAFGDRFRLPQSVVNLVRAGHHGVKTGRGFFPHDRQGES